MWILKKLMTKYLYNKIISNKDKLNKIFHQKKVDNMTTICIFAAYKFIESVT